MREDDDCLVELICEFALNSDMPKRFSQESKGLLISNSNDKKFTSALDKAIEAVQF